MASNLSSEDLAAAALGMQELLSPHFLHRLEERVALAKQDVEKKKTLVSEGISELRGMLDKKERELISYLDSISDKMEQSVDEMKQNIRRVELGRREIASKFEESDETSKETESIFQLVDASLLSLKYNLLMLPQAHISWNEEPEFDAYLRDLCKIEVNQNVYTFRNVPRWSSGSKGEEKGAFSYPMGLAVRGDGSELFISDHLANEVKILDKKGELMRTITDESLKHPCSIELFQDAVFVVCDKALIKFDAVSMDKLEHVDSSQTLRGVAVDGAKEEVYVCERYVIKVKVHDVSLKSLRSFDLEIEYSSEPDAIRVRDMKLVNKELYVLLSESSVTLRTFDEKGSPVRSILYKDQIDEAYFFTLDPLNNILLGDVHTGSVLVCTNHGFELGEIDPVNLKGKSKWMPQGLALDEDFNLFVVSDNENDVIQAF